MASYVNQNKWGADEQLKRLQGMLYSGAITKGQYAQMAQGAGGSSGYPASSGGGQTDTGWQQQINDIYGNSQKAQQEKLNAQYQEQQADYNNQMNNEGETYNPMRNQAYVNNAMAERARRESMANMGLSGAGGASQTVQQSNTNSLLNTLGDIKRQQQDYTNNINLALGKLSAQYNADTGSLSAQTESDKDKALLDQGNWESNYGLSQQQEQQREKDSEFSRDMALYKISSKKKRKQIRDKWGI